MSREHGKNDRRRGVESQREDPEGHNRARASASHHPNLKALHFLFDSTHDSS